MLSTDFFLIFRQQVTIEVYHYMNISLIEILFCQRSHFSLCLSYQTICWGRQDPRMIGVNVIRQQTRVTKKTRIAFLFRLKDLQACSSRHGSAFIPYDRLITPWLHLFTALIHILLFYFASDIIVILKRFSGEETCHFVDVVGYIVITLSQHQFLKKM